ncbi:MAG: hypothetical protein A2Z12_06880 [Actinobacteria bacterium RBG_16_68_21]|nr:MAG: hypothetical protein A2Z12_06880 [Actinobacteria bacterium RBG_16_68_21]
MAAVLAVVVAIAHSYLGERFIIGRLLRRENLPLLFGTDLWTRRILRFAWHLTTIAWFGFAGVLMVLADHFGDAAPLTAVLAAGDPQATARGVAQAVAATFALNAMVTAIGSRGRHVAWVVFAAIAALTWLAV